MKRLLMVGMVALGLGGTALAEPLDRAHVSSDAKWVMHLNFDAARQTKLAEQFREKRLEDPDVQVALTWLEARYGINVRKDLQGVTAYGVDYEPHSGVVVLRTAYDREKIDAVMTGREGYETQTYRDYTVHSWVADGERRPAVALPDENTVVLANKVEKLQLALDVLDQEKPSLPSDSPLLEQAPSDAVFYGSAVELKQLQQRPGFAVLQQAERVSVSVTEKEQRTCLDAKFVAKSPEVAEKVMDIADGFRTLLALQAEELPEDLQKLLAALGIERDEQTIQVRWEAEADQLLELGKKVRQRHMDRAPAKARPE